MKHLQKDATRLFAKLGEYVFRETPFPFPHSVACAYVHATEWMRAIFKNAQRRRALLYGWLQLLPPTSILTTANTADKLMEYYLQSIAVERSSVRVLATTIQFNANIVLSKAHFTEQEVDSLLQGTPDKDFDECARGLWLRDFLGVVYDRKWTMYALVAIQRLIFVQRNYLPMLMNAEHMLQGQGGRPDRMPFL
jgi:hypothetical protein